MDRCCTLLLVLDTPAMYVLLEDKEASIVTVKVLVLDISFEKATSKIYKSRIPCFGGNPKSFN